MNIKWVSAMVFCLSVGAADAQTGLIVSANAGGLTLSWLDNSNNETAFLIERSLPNDVCVFEQIGSLPADATSFSDVPIAVGARWCYRVLAANDVGVSLPSNVACATAPDPTPPPTSASGTFTKDATHPGPFSVSIDAYTCTRVVGGTAKVRIYQGATLLKDGSLVNPPNGVLFTLTCAVTPSEVLFTVDNVLKLTAPR